MLSFQIWDGKQDVFCGGILWSAEEWTSRYPQAQESSKTMVVVSSDGNGGKMMDLDEIKAIALRDGISITESMSAEEVLAAVNNFMQRQFPVAEAYAKTGIMNRAVVTAEDRMAAATEAQLMLAEPDSPAPAVHSSDLFAEFYGRPVSPGLARIRDNFVKGLWSESLVRLAVQKGRITADEAASVLGCNGVSVEGNVVSLRAFG